jgi:hypothetical protein
MPKRVTLVYVRKTTGVLMQRFGTPNEIVEHMEAQDLVEADVIVVQGDPLTFKELGRRAKLERAILVRRSAPRKP